MSAEIPTSLSSLGLQSDGPTHVERSNTVFHREAKASLCVYATSALALGHPAWMHLTAAAATAAAAAPRRGLSQRTALDDPRSKRLERQGAQRSIECGRDPSQIPPVHIAHSDIRWDLRCFPDNAGSGTPWRLQRVDTVQRRSSDTDESGPLTAAPTCISSCNG